MSKPDKKKLILLSAGGTGGHMTPAKALADDLLSRGYDVVLATDPRGEKLSSIFKNVPVHVVKAGVIKPGIGGKINALLTMGIGVLQAFKLLRKTRPDLVVGFGGYPSFPAVYVAQKLKIPTIIHEQNAIIGKANAYLANKAERIALSLPDITGLDDFDKIRAVITGNPVRSEIAALYNEPYPALEQDGELRILITGGSLGAKVLSEIVPKTLAMLSDDYKKRLKITQQCREEDLESVKDLYRQSGISAEISTFFDDIPERLRTIHLVIGRSGASTVAELATAGRPAIFVPYPHHKDQQQKMNADAMADAGGAWVMTEGGFTQEALLARIETFMQDPSVLFRAAEKARICGKPDAARKLGNLVTALASGWND